MLLKLFNILIRDLLYSNTHKTGLWNNQYFMKQFQFKVVGYCKYGLNYRKQTRLVVQHYKLDATIFMLWVCLDDVLVAGSVPVV